MSQTRALIAGVLFALAGCSGPEHPEILAATPSMVSICARPSAPFADVVALAQAQCARNGKNATIIHRDQCGNPNTDLVPSAAYHFRCE